MTHSLRSRFKQPATPPRWRRHVWLLFALLLALALRLLLWGRIPRIGLISDEGEYLAAANWLAHGRGFGWYQGYLWTRAPLYPLFVAAHLRLFGDHLAPIYVSQIALSLLNVALIYILARQIVLQASSRAQRLVPPIAALVMALYFPFALYTQTLLSETLFLALLLSGFLALARWERAAGGKHTANTTHTSHLTPQNWLVVAGAIFGLATLTRSLTLLFLPVVAIWLVAHQIHHKGTKSTKDRTTKRTFVPFVSLWLYPAVFLLASALVILPWTIYNSRMYGGLVVVDTSGAFNVLLGGRTAYDGDRNDAATRDFVLVLLGQKQAADAAVKPCIIDYPQPLPATQAQRQAAMTREGMCLIRARPLAFAQKSLAELVDFFQINPTGAERFLNKFSSGRISPWYALAVFALDDTLYVLVLPLAVIGWALLRTKGRRQDDQTFILHPSSFILLIGLWWLYNLAVAPLLFAINRFRLPLLPFAFICTAYALAELPGGWRALRSLHGGLCAALAVVLFLIAATPYAYLEPRPPGADSRWASYLGPYPSSLAITRLALELRPSFLRAEQFRAALQGGRPDEAAAVLAAGDLATVRIDGIAASTIALAGALLDEQDGKVDTALHQLPSEQMITSTKDVEAAIVLGDLLRRKGGLAEGRAMLGQTFVDNNNPVEWAWEWLRPAPLPDNTIDIAGNLDLGYISGCYLGEGDTSMRPAANFRWCSDGARLRFPGAGTGTPQALALRADGRGWAGYAPTPPPVSVFVGDQLAGTFTPDIHGPREFTIALPASPQAADVIVTLRTETFIPGADRYLRQQGKAVVGQVQRLGVRLDWAALRGQ